MRRFCVGGPRGSIKWQQNGVSTVSSLWEFCGIEPPNADKAFGLKWRVQDLAVSFLGFPSGFFLFSIRTECESEQNMNVSIYSIERGPGQRLDKSYPRSRLDQQKSDPPTKASRPMFWCTPRGAKVRERQRWHLSDLFWLEKPTPLLSAAGPTRGGSWRQ